jgi:hypothetical protein
MHENLIRFWFRTLNMRVPLAESRIEHQWLISGKQPKTVFYHLHAG